jgi:glycosyltransferase involved in cell wall biosynthesis
MRILYVLFNAPPLHSGRARQALMLAEELNRRPGVQVQAISLDQGQVIAPPYPPPLRRRLDVWQAKQVWRVILAFCLRERIQVVHFHGHNYATHLTPVLRLLGIRCFQHMTRKGFDDPATLLDGRGSRLQRYALSRLSAWIVQNPDDVIAHTRPPVVNIPNAVAPPRPRVETPGKRTIVLSGVVCPRKGQLEVLRLFAALPAPVRAGLRLRLAGSYTDDFWEFDADYVARCRSLAATLPEAALLGHLSTQELTDELRQAHYFFAISAVEGLSNAYLECLNQGLLPITYTDRHDPLFDTLAITDALIRLPAGDPAHGAAALAAALADEPWSEPLARDLQARVAAGFGLTRIADRLLALYRNPVAPEPGASIQ